MIIRVEIEIVDAIRSNRRILVIFYRRSLFDEILVKPVYVVSHLFPYGDKLLEDDDDTDDEEELEESDEEDDELG